MRRALVPLALAVIAAGCASVLEASAPPPWPERLQTLLPADVVLFGEQHDAPDHQRLQRDAVEWLWPEGNLLHW